MFILIKNKNEHNYFRNITKKQKIKNKNKNKNKAIYHCN